MLSAIAREAKASWGYPPVWLAQWAPALTLDASYIARHRVYVAEGEGSDGGERVLGLCALADHGAAWSLEHVWVRRAAQGRGVGRLLVEHALAEARAGGGVRPVHVESDPHAAAFYAGLGARRIGAVAAPMPGAPARVLPIFEFDGSASTHTLAAAIEVTEEPVSALAEYARVPISFEVRQVLHIAAPDRGLGGLVLTVRDLHASYIKDYDAIPGASPLDWPARFDLTSWTLLAAYAGDRRVGGATVVGDAAGLDMLEGRTDLAVLWDLRVAPDARHAGVGSALLGAAERRAMTHGARSMKIETQNINVPACRFYARQGYTLGSIHRFANPTLPDEAQLLWYKDLA
ncbi:MAG: GNAT family N-acetyltransferase [Gemmatimonadaceae bacterium]